MIFSTTMVVFAEESLTDKLTDGVKSLIRNNAENLETIVDMVGDIVKYTVEKFSDVKESDWFTQTVSKLVGLGIIDGYPDGTFKPEGSINTDAFIKMTVTALGHNLENGENYWAEPYMEKAKEIDLIETGEISDSTRPINRAEIARIIVRAMDEDFPGDIENYITEIKDYDSIPDGFKEYVLKAYVKGIVTGYPDGSFGYDKNATRAEASTMLIRMLDEEERKLPKIEEIVERVEEITEEDIKRLQKYEVYNITKYFDSNKNEWVTGVDPDFISFDDESEFTRKRRNNFIKLFKVNNITYKDGTKVYTNNEDLEFLTEPNLIYIDPIGRYVIRGILNIKTSQKSNPWNISSNKWYVVDVEYKYKLTTDGDYLKEVNYLSKFKKVK